MRHYRLPSSSVDSKLKTTTDPNEYAEAWRILGEELLKALGPDWLINGYDPNISVFQTHVTALGQTIWINHTSLPMEIVRRIIALHKQASERPKVSPDVG